MKAKIKDRKLYLPVQIHLTLNPYDDDDYRLIDHLTKKQISYGTLGVSYAKIAKGLMMESINTLQSIKKTFNIED